MDVHFVKVAFCAGFVVKPRDRTCPELTASTFCTTYSMCQPKSNDTSSLYECDNDITDLSSSTSSESDISPSSFPSVPSWLTAVVHEGMTDDLIDIAARYCLYRRYRQDGRVGSGVAVYVRQGLLCIFQPQHNDVSLEALWLLFHPNIMPREVSHTLIGSVYRPPKANNTEMTDYLIIVLDSVHRDHFGFGILLCCNFN